MAKEIIVFYSRAGENYVSGQLRQLSVGNTEVAAGIIAELTGAERFKLEQSQPYDKGYNKCIAQAQEDQRRDARPALKAFPQGIEHCDIIYLGYPNYWSTMPMAVFTFLERSDFTGKEIRPFCTHEGSGLGRSVGDIKRLCPGANVRRGLAITGSSAARSKKDIEKWLQSMK